MSYGNPVIYIIILHKQLPYHVYYDKFKSHLNLPYNKLNMVSLNAIL